MVLGDQPDRLDLSYDLGVRRVQMTYNRSNNAGCGCMELRDEGLTIWGRELIQRMNEIGILVDTGHVGMENNSGYPNLTRGLIVPGYSDEDIAKIMGGNFLR